MKYREFLMKASWRFYDACGCDICLKTIDDDHLLAFDGEDQACGGRICRKCVKRIAKFALSAPAKRVVKDASP